VLVGADDGLVEARQVLFVVELVHEVRLEGSVLAVDGVLRRRVPVHLVEVVLLAED